MNTLIIMNVSSGYFIGGIVALAVMLYLIYSLLKPDKF